MTITALGLVWVLVWVLLQALRTLCASWEADW